MHASIRYFQCRVVTSAQKTNLLGNFNWSLNIVFQVESRWLKYHHSTLFQQITEKYSKMSSCRRRYHRFCTLGISRWTLHEIDHDHLSIGGDRLWILKFRFLGVNSIKFGLIEIWLSNSSQRSAAHLIIERREGYFRSL